MECTFILINFAFYFTTLNRGLVKFAFDCLKKCKSQHFIRYMRPKVNSHYSLRLLDVVGTVYCKIYINFLVFKLYLLISVCQCVLWFLVFSAVCCNPANYWFKINVLWAKSLHNFVEPIPSNIWSKFLMTFTNREPGKHVCY